MALSASPVRAAERVGRFELKRVIGRGSQSTVWLAHDPRLARDVALKLMTPDTSASLGDWLTEARHVAALNHPHVVPVFEADVHGSGPQAQPYLVFEYISGGVKVPAPAVAAAIARRARRSNGCSACSTRWPRRMPAAWCTAT